LRPVEENPHAQCFGALSRDQAHLTTDVVVVFKPPNFGFIPLRIAFQARDAFFDGSTETRANFECVVGSAVGEHRQFLEKSR
jgi:hypothetical protein